MAQADFDPSAGISIRPVAGNPNGDPWAAFQPITPDAVEGAKPAKAGQAAGDPWAQYHQVQPADLEPKGAPDGREIGSGEATLRGAAHGISFGTQPAIAGASAAANPDIEAAAKKFGIDPETAKSFLDHVAPGLKTMYGAGRLAVDAATGDGTQPTPAQQSYEKTRKSEAESNDAAYEQHPVLYTGADLVGSVAAPIPGAASLKAGTIGARIGRGMLHGAEAGGMFGAGEEIGQGKSAPDILEGAGKGAAVGGALGGAIGGVVGPRVPSNTGSAAADTAERLGAPLPKGVASDSPFVQATTAKLKSYPVVGEKIGERVGQTEEAAGNKIGEMASDLAGGSPERSATDASVRPSLKQVVTNRKGELDSAYNELRSNINPDQRFKLPALESTLKAVELARTRAGWDNPSQGLEKAWKLVKEGGGFNGVHRLRRELREAGNPMQAHPGYDAGDFKRLAGAVNADLKNIVRKASTDPNKAESLFNTAELKAGEIIRNNEALEKLIDSKGEGAVATLLGATKEKGGNLPLLRQLKATMPPAAFEQVAGTLLHELGYNAASTSKFSLRQFETNWAKLSDGAKDVMFSPQHRQWIEDIAGLARHIKDSGRYASTSHSADLIVLLDIAKDAALLGGDLMSGGLGLGSAVGAGTSVGIGLFTKWLASPATAKSMSAWTKAYRGLTLNQPTPARIAAFRMATRNLAHNINLPVDRVMEIVQDRIGSGSSADAAEPHHE